MRIAIVGAGPSGTALALMLAQQGIESSVFEARESATSRDRGDVLHPSGQHAIAQLGLQPNSNDDAMRIMRFSLAREGGDPIASIDASSGLNLVSWRHSSLMESLRHRAEQSPEVSIGYGARVRRLIQEGNCTLGVETESGAHRADLTVLALGGVSHLLNGRISKPRKFRSRFVNTVVESHPDWLGTAAYILNPAGVSVLVPLAHGQTRIGIQLQGNEHVVSEAESLTMLRKRLPWWNTREALEKPTTHVLMSHGPGPWGQPGLVILGDAAHKLHPIGGHGMNTALADASALSELIRRNESPLSIHQELCKLRAGKVRKLRRWTDLYGRFGDSPRQLAIAGALKFQSQVVLQLLLGHLAIRVDRLNHDAEQ